MKKITIIMEYHNDMGYQDGEFNETLQSLVGQNYANWELKLVDFTGANAAYPAILKDERIQHLPGDYKNHAAGLNAGLTAAGGDYTLLVNNRKAKILFRLSTLESLLLVAERNPEAGMVYADYLTVEADGQKKPVHLLDYHEGRMRDNMDYGAMLLFRTAALKKVGGFDEKYNAAELYDVQLKVAGAYKVVHVAAKVNGHAYIVHAASKSQNVFDYLLASKETQLEMEAALTEHLKQINVYLAPGQNYHEIEYTPEELARFDECIASIIIPVFNRREFIGTAIESVQAQTVPNVEILVMSNGGPTDPTIEGVKPYLPGGEKYDPNKAPVRLFIEDMNNLGFCFNKGLREARGKFYVQLDSDDRLKPDAVEKLMEVFNSDPRIGMVIGSYDVWKKDEKTGELSRMEDIPVVTHAEWTEDNGRNNLLRINGAGAPRSAHIKTILSLGGFGMNDTPYCRNYGEDYDLVLRMSEKYRIGRVWEPIYEVIRHSGGTDHNIDQATVDLNDNAKDYMRLEAVHRRRQINQK
jgi:GT2 family glycosyltransferase